MSPSQHESAGEQPAAMQPTRPEVEPERRLPYPEGPPLMSLFAAALISFVFLATASWTMFPFLTEFLDMGGGLGPLLLPTFGQRSGRGTGRNRRPDDHQLDHPAGGTASQGSWLASLRRVIPGRLGSDLAVGPGAWRLIAGVARVRSHDRGDLLPALAGVHLGANDLGMIARTVLEIESDSIALGRVFVLRTTVKEGFRTGQFPDQFGLKDQGRVAEFLGLPLAVDEEEGNAPEVVPLPAGRVMWPSYHKVGPSTRVRLMLKATSGSSRRGIKMGTKNAPFPRNDRVDSFAETVRFPWESWTFNLVENQAR